MVVWKPALSRDRLITSIAMSPIHGPEELASKLQEAMITNQPPAGSPIAFLSPAQLEEITQIQLAGYDGQPSDIAGLSAARRANVDVLLQGQIVRWRTEPQEPKQGKLDGRYRPSENMTVSWTVTDVATGERIGSNTMTLERSQAENAFPELAQLGGEPIDRVAQGLARESWTMFAPNTTKEDTILVLPWFLPGASKIRQGNGYARLGRWDLAEQQWQDAASKHSWNKAAWHNLALSAAAREDFELARRRLEHAQTVAPNDRADKTHRWLDEKQHDYHRAHRLPDREGGWLVPDPPPAVSPDEVPSTEPQQIDDLPWWTAIPGTKPPGWTWRQWLFQPLVL
jgi:tetratricopeptide (TPR) repeat protein